MNVALPGIGTVGTINPSAVATILAVAAALIVTVGLFWAFGGNAAKRGAIVGVSSLSLLATAAFLDTYNPNLDFGALVERAAFTTYGLPFMTMVFAVTIALMAVGGLEFLFDDESRAARAEKRRLSTAAMFANDRPVTANFFGPTATAQPAYSGGGRTDVLSNGWGRRPAHAAA